ncbi:MAG: hypothetical protein ACE5HJ_08215 [Thermoplasmata archaeon]
MSPHDIWECRIVRAHLTGRVETWLGPMTSIFVVLTLAVFLSPVFILGAPDALRTDAQVVVDALSSGLLLLQLVILGISLPLLARQAHASSNSFSLVLMGAAGIVAVANATRLTLGVHWPGLGAELAQVLWFAAPLVLWALALWPALHGPLPTWWARPMQWIVFTFPLIFVIAALGRVDFRPYTGVQTPTAIAWLLAYTPTLLGVVLALVGWLAFEEHQKASSRSLVLDLAGVFLPALVIAALVSANTFIGFILSATITWGSGYQLFRTPPPLAPLTVSFLLVTAAFSALMVTLFRLRRDRRLVMGPLLAFAAVLSGIFPSSISILGSLVALELLWLNVARAGVLP